VPRVAHRVVSSTSCDALFGLVGISSCGIARIVTQLVRGICRRIECFAWNTARGDSLPRRHRLRARRLVIARIFATTHRFARQARCALGERRISAVARRRNIYSISISAYLINVCLCMKMAGKRNV